MRSLKIILDLEKDGIREETAILTNYAGPVTIGVMPNGVGTGKPTVMIAIEDPETGGFKIIEMPLELFLSVGRTFENKYGKPQ